jgi:aspartyl-tRNA(Asn)/glutamyl-tRNA(Gln) amidotransferase subunit B
LPVLNREAVAMAIRAGLALSCAIQRNSLFARKNYFYPDLPKGYQISQYDLPLATDGEVTVLTGDRLATGKVENHRLKTFGITRIHLEDDAGKSIHAAGDDTYVNLNRTGVPLIEIVSEPDFRSSQEAYDYLNYLRTTLLYLGVCDGNMDEGSLRCDANVSVRPVGTEPFGTKTEIKNLNSFRFLQKALDYEISRQISVLRKGGEIYQETRLWSEQGQETILMRSKEYAHDYRYFPEPDLMPVLISEEWISELGQTIPELPEVRRQRLVSEFSLKDEEAMQVVRSRGFADFFEEAAAASGEAKEVYNWMLGDLTRFLKRDGKQISECAITSKQIASLIRLVSTGTISGKLAKGVFEKMYESGQNPEAIVEASGVRQISDEGELGAVISRILEANPGKVDAYQSGKTGLIGFFVGQVMRETKGQANPQVVNKLLKNLLGD